MPAVWLSDSRRRMAGVLVLQGSPRVWLSRVFALSPAAAGGGFVSQNVFDFAIRFRLWVSIVQWCVERRLPRVVRLIFPIVPEPGDSVGRRQWIGDFTGIACAFKADICAQA
jgi:hypothetical protein